MSQERKTHWTITYRTLGGDTFVESTRAAGIEPATEKEMKEGLAAVIADRARTPLPTIYVLDQRRDYRPTLVFLGRMSHVELAPDIQPGDPDPEAQRHLELVLEDPDHRQRAQDAWKDTVAPEGGNYGPGQPRVRDLRRTQLPGWPDPDARAQY